jgi:hypothetical protein
MLGKTEYRYVWITPLNRISSGTAISRLAYRVIIGNLDKFLLFKATIPNFKK